MRIPTKKPSRDNLYDAIDSANIEAKDWDLKNFDLKYEGEMSVEDMWNYDDLSSWLETDRGGEEDLDNFRGKDWADMARSWEKNIPPVVLITAPYEEQLYTQVGDGRGRINYANVYGYKFPVWHLVWKSKIKEIRIPTLKVVYLRENKKSNKWLWHISNERFRKFNTSKTAQGIIWFAKSKEDLIKNLHGASIRSDRPIWLYKCTANVSNPAGWDEYDKYFLGELRSLGYDSIDLDEDFVVLDAENIKIHEIKRVTEEDSQIDEEYLGTKGGVQYFQMGGSLPKRLYNRKKRKGSKDPGVAGLEKGKSSSEELEREEEKKKHWYQASIKEIYFK